MGKRPYYIIIFDRDCEGYYTDVCYIGTNWKAALDRYRTIIDCIKEVDFLNEGVDPDHIYSRVNLPERQLNPGEQIQSYLNDDNVCWDTITLKCMNTNKFTNNNWETKYKALFPNSKY